MGDVKRQTYEQEYVTKAPYMSKADVIECRTFYFREDWLMEELAELYGVSISTISNVINAKRYYARYPIKPGDYNK